MLTTQKRSTIIAAIVNDAPVGIVYADADGILSARTIRPRTVERCKVNGETIVRAFDIGRDAPRSFRLNRIERAA